MGFSRLLVSIRPSGWYSINRCLFTNTLRMERLFIQNLRRSITTIPPTTPPPPPNDGNRSSKSKKFMAAIGTALAATGAAIGYKIYNEELSVEYKAECSDSDGACATDCSKCGESSCLHKMDKEEALIAQANSDLEKALKDVKPKAQAATEAALKENEQATQQALEQASQLAIEQASQLAVEQAKELSQAQEKEKEADLSVMNAMLLQKIDEVKQFYEEDLKKSLLRQAQVLQDIFDAAKRSMQEEFDRKLNQHSELAEAENLVDLRDKYSQAASALAAMEKTLRDRHGDDVKSEKFKRLWSQCNSLYNRLNFAGFVSNNIENDTICINKKMLLKEFEDDEFTQTLLTSIPEEVSSAESLRERFFSKVDKVCRRVAIFKDEDNISLWKYLLGTIQASVTIKCEGDNEDDASVYGLLDRAGYFLKRGDLLEATITLNKIQGAVPRRICQDWLNDARALLETNQTLFALMTHATANNLH